ncbi:MAG: thioredoxin fold domain-containing protein [Betaproteobacteria bacterium]|nr:thioredoxin fold domain-containing protein [Betaproteobacteria bacterium]
MNPITALARTLAVAFAILLNTTATTDAAPPSSRADSVLAGAPKATWIAEGQGRRPVYIFFDPNCPSCQLLYKNLRSFIGSHDLQLRWIPVAVVDATSLGKAAAILQASDPPAALRRNEEHYDAQAYAGGIEEDIPSAETERKVRANERLLNKLDIPVVPSMLFAAKNGHAVLIQGALSPLALRKVFAHLP